jgi:hypothetical protein
MSRQRLLWPLWHESLAEPRTSWVSGQPCHGRLVYGSAGLPPCSSPDHRGDFDGEEQAKVPTVFESRKARFLRAGCAILRNPFRGVICPVGGVAGRYDRRQ